MFFSLVVPTINRKTYLINLLKSLEKQDFKNFEVIIIDQNPKDFLRKIITKWEKKLNIIYKNVKFKGACKARNFGTKFAKGKYIAYPDDDTEYPNETLSLVAKEFSIKDEADIILCNCLDQNLIKNHLIKKNKKVYLIESIYSLFKERIVTSQIFATKSCIDSYSQYIFDEMMGPGANSPFASNDETDFLLRALNSHKKIYINRNISIFHPTNCPGYKKSYYYGLGRFRLIQKHNLGLGFYFINIIFPIIKLVYTMDFRKTKSYIASAIGRSGITYNRKIFEKFLRKIDFRKRKKI